MSHRKHRNPNLSLHHRKCTSNGGDNSKRNTIFLPQKLHDGWHFISQNYSPFVIAQIINTKLLDPDYEFVCRRR